MQFIAYFFAFLGPVLYGVANVLDNFLVGKLFKNIPALVFYSELINLFFIPLVWLVEAPIFPGWNMAPVFVAVGACDLLYLYPYYKALQEDDTAIVSSLFAMGKICVPVLAFLIVGEVLKVSQYLGFGFVIASSILLTLNTGRRRWYVGPAFFYMILASFLISLEIVLYKYLFENVAWSTGFVSATLSAFILSTSMLLIEPLRRRIQAGWPIFRRRFVLIAGQEFFTLSGTASYTYATSLLPATVIAGIGESQPFFVLFYALFFAPFFPTVFREKVDGRSLIKKVGLFAITIVGAWLILR